MVVWQPNALIAPTIPLFSPIVWKQLTFSRLIKTSINYYFFMARYAEGFCNSPSAEIWLRWQLHQSLLWNEPYLDEEKKWIYNYCHKAFSSDPFCAGKITAQWLCHRVYELEGGIEQRLCGPAVSQFASSGAERTGSSQRAMEFSMMVLIRRWFQMQYAKQHAHRKTTGFSEKALVFQKKHCCF